MVVSLAAEKLKRIFNKLDSYFLSSHHENTLMV